MAESSAGSRTSMRTGEVVDEEELVGEDVTDEEGNGNVALI